MGDDSPDWKGDWKGVRRFAVTGRCIYSKEALVTMKIKFITLGEEYIF
jgi:hypothetical protein